MCGCSEMIGGALNSNPRINKMSYAELVAFLKRRMKKT